MRNSLFCLSKALKNTRVSFVFWKFVFPVRIDPNDKFISVDSHIKFVALSSFDGRVEASFFEYSRE